MYVVSHGQYHEPIMIWHDTIYEHVYRLLYMERHLHIRYEIVLALRSTVKQSVNPERFAEWPHIFYVVMVCGRSVYRSPFMAL